MLGATLELFGLFKATEISYFTCFWKSRIGSASGRSSSTVSSFTGAAPLASLPFEGAAAALAGAFPVVAGAD
jgi:hypothetical protein